MHKRQKINQQIYKLQITKSLVMQTSMRKPKKEEKEDKMKAFMSFLEAPTMSDSVILDSQKKNNSDNQNYEEFVEDTNQCNICRERLNPVKKKKCGFCSMETCDNHLRKRRRLNKKFQRICDYCEDKHLFDNYMKLQIKAQEALATQEQIVGMKYNEFMSQVQKKREKRNELIFQAEGVKSKHQEQLQAVKQKQIVTVNDEKTFQKQQFELKQLQMIVGRLGSSMKENFEEDYKILLIQNQRLGKDLINLDKRKQQIRKAIEKREKEIEAAYEQWEKKEYIKNMQRQSAVEAKQKKDCEIY